jgi:arylsulfatase A-like enzyme
MDAAVLDARLPDLVTRFFKEEVAAVLPVSQRDRWPKDDPATEFAANDLDLERSGDAFIIPKPNVLMHWDSARGTNHGTHHDYDTHVPLVFWGPRVRPGRVDAPSTPYDVAPTLAAALGLTLPDAIGKDRLAP